jgi:uncharacterized protein (TIGR03084 family)
MDESIRALRAEGMDLEGLVSDLTTEQWRTPTPAVGWTVAHQIGHLQWSDEGALLAIADPTAFAEILEQAARTPLDVTDAEAARRAQWPAADLLDRWRAGRERLATALADVPADERIPWFGPALKPRSMVTARLMETWAHGQDVADALGVTRTPTQRLRDVAHLGVRSRDYAYRVNGLEPPAAAFRVELRAPDGGTWTWGPEDAAERVTGSAEAFCLVVTQRREVGEVDIAAHGEEAARWLRFAQAFAGPPKDVVRASLAGRDRP